MPSGGARKPLLCGGCARPSRIEGSSGRRASLAMSAVHRERVTPVQSSNEAWATKASRASSALPAPTAMRAE